MSGQGSHPKACIVGVLGARRTNSRRTEINSIQLLPVSRKVQGGTASCSWPLADGMDEGMSL